MLQSGTTHIKQNKQQIQKSVALIFLLTGRFSENQIFMLLFASQIALCGAVFLIVKLNKQKGIMQVKNMCI